MTHVALCRPLRSAVRPIRPLTVFVMMALLLGQLGAIPATAKQASLPTPNLHALVAEAQTKGAVRVIVGVRANAAPEGTLADGAAVERQRRGIGQAQQAVIDRMAGRNLRVNARYTYIPFLALSADAATLQALAADPDVVSVRKDGVRKPVLGESVPLIGGSATGTFGTAQRTGAGQTVAILDTGVMKTHAFLANKVVSEACYSTTDATDGSLAVCQSNSTAPGSGVNCTTAIDGCEHGTHVAGIVAGKAYPGQPNGPFNGVAKDATLIAMQVFSRYEGAENCEDVSPCVSSLDSDQIKALERVYALRTTYNIAAANMSLGGGKYFATCDDEPLKASIDLLKSVGIATIIASGNEYFTNAVGAPACISSAVTVGSTTKQDTVSSFSNSAPMVDILAPGSAINSSVIASTTAFASFDGTSMATPHVAGAWAVIKQHKPTATVAEVLAALQNTGKPVVDRRNNLSRKRIQLTAAVNAITGTVNPVPVLTSITPATREAGYPTFTLTVTGSKFMPTSVVLWKGANRPTTYVSATQLRATISKTDIATAGTAAVTVFSPTPGGGTSASKSFTITAPKTAPKPAITSLSPASRAAGTGAFTLIVKSTTNTFVPRSVVRWAGVVKPTIYVSATELRATIAASDMTTQGVKAVTVFTSAPGGGISNAMNFTISASSMPPCTIDEPNNAIGSAKTIPFGTARTYAICRVGDKDFIKLSGIAGRDYTIEAFNPAPALDLVIQIFDASGTLVYEPIDDGAEGAGEAVSVPFSANETLYIAFSQYANDAGGSNFTYSVRVTPE